MIIITKYISVCFHQSMPSSNHRVSSVRLHSRYELGICHFRKQPQLWENTKVIYAGSCHAWLPRSVHVIVSSWMLGNILCKRLRQQTEKSCSVSPVSKSTLDWVRLLVVRSGEARSTSSRVSNDVIFMGLLIGVRGRRGVEWLAESVFGVKGWESRAAQRSCADWEDVSVCRL